MSKQTEALKLALEALSPWAGEDANHTEQYAAYHALREALAEQPAQYRSTGWAAHRDQYAVPVLFSPYTGEPRDVRDVQSDPQGILIVPPGKVEMRAAKQTHHTEQHLEMVQPAQPQQEPAQQQEPVAWMMEGWGPDCGPYVEFYRDDEMGWRDRKEWTPLYTSPQRKPLTDEQIWDEVKAADLDWQTGWSLDEDASNRYITFARAIEAAHGIKE